MNRVLAAAALAFSSLAFAKEPVSMADMKALADQKSFSELLDKAERVAPAERTAEWKTLVAQAALNLIGPSKKLKFPFEEALTADALSDRYKFLDDDAKFNAARDEAVVKGLKDCMDDGEYSSCWDVEAKLEKTLKGDAALKAAKAFVKFGSFKYRPMVLFANAVTGKDAAACKDADLEPALIASFDLPPDYDGAKAAVRVAFGDCWGTLSGKAKQWMVGAESYRLSNLCKPMRAKKALSELQEDLCKDAEQ